MANAIKCDFCSNFSEINYRNIQFESGPSTKKNSYKIYGVEITIQSKNNHHANFQPSAEDTCETCFKNILQSALQKKGLLWIEQNQMDNFLSILKQDPRDMNPKSIDEWKKKLIRSITSLRPSLTTTN